MSEESPRDAVRQLPRIDPLGDSALLVTLGEEIDVALSERAHGLAAAVDRLRAMDSRFHRAVPAVASVLVPFDPVTIDPDEARGLIAGLLGADRAAKGGPNKGLVKVSLSGPDLEAFKKGIV